MSELGYWVDHFWRKRPTIMVKVNNIHSSTINYTQLGMDPSNNYKTETYLNESNYIKIWEDKKIIFKFKRANIVEVFRFKINEIDLNSYDTVKYYS